MRIPCPFCGERASGEFVVAGDATCNRPSSDVSDARMQFVDAVYVRNNPAGRHTELWYHLYGCRSWLRVTRDTVTHEIYAVEFARQVDGT
jgi:methylglutamate dehydrogenase subunit B